MKKNLVSVLILALVMANLVLTAMLAFTIIPQTKKSNELIDKVCAAISLDLESGSGGASAALDIPMENIESYSIADNFTVGLQKSSAEEGGDGEQHYAVFSVGLSMNTKSSGYKTYKGAEGLTEKEPIIRDRINTIVSSYTMEEFKEDNYQVVKDEILVALQEMFDDPEFIIAVNFSDVNVE